MVFRVNIPDRVSNGVESFLEPLKAIVALSKKKKTHRVFLIGLFKYVDAFRRPFEVVDIEVVPQML